jgi:hypothetical protein
MSLQNLRTSRSGDREKDNNTYWDSAADFGSSLATTAQATRLVMMEGEVDSQKERFTLTELLHILDYS